MPRQTFAFEQLVTSTQMNTLQASVWTDDVNAQTISYTLVIGDAGKQVQITSASATTLTVPPNSVAFATGVVIKVMQLGAGTVTIAQGAGVTFTDPSGGSSTTVNVPMFQYQINTLVKTATDTWLVIRGPVATDDQNNVLATQVYS
jgi:hypothetical protein